MDKLLISLFPILGCFYKPSFKKYLLVAIGIPLFLLLAVWVIPYDYSISWLDDLLIMIALSGIWGLAVSHADKKESMYTFSAFLALALGAIIFMVAMANAFTGSNTVLKHWKKDSYQVNYIRSSGFSGQPLYYYELEKRNAWGLLEAKLDRNEQVGVYDSLCEIKLFDKIDRRMLRFDKCKEIIHLPD
ncbi:MAG: hypothetical protein K0R51_839 [Cytophagaceae bacterium]|jgi:hypothetical protein|nr:hypothetical protein [Cytophagaceae bacterium]